MARSSSNSKRGRRGHRANSAYLGLAVVTFIAILVALFWGRSAGPHEAAAGGGSQDANAVTETAGPASPLAVETPPQSERPAAPEPTPEAVAPGPVAQDTEPAPAPADADTLGAENQDNAEVAEMVAQAQALLRSQPGKIIEVRDQLNGALAMPASPQQRQAIKDELAGLSEDWLFGPAVFAGDTLCGTYPVKSGDLLQVIGRRHKVPYEILMEINHIRRPQSLQAGKTIKVIHGPFHAKVSRSSFTLDLYLQDTYVRSFQVGLGAPGTETPTGLWRVQEGGKLIKPEWYDEKTGRTYKPTDPDYPLGSRWIALDGVSGQAKGRTGFAIHGTKDPDQIGMAGSRGCIRMFNGEAILVYNLLVPLYSKAEVVE